jgi:hypothetical protein
MPNDVHLATIAMRYIKKTMGSNVPYLNTKMDLFEALSMFIILLILDSILISHSYPLLNEKKND